MTYPVGLTTFGSNSFGHPTPLTTQKGTANVLPGSAK